jgi:Xaa-Pro dipeptidase
LLKLLRAVKADAEIRQLAMAAGVAEAAMTEALGQARPGDSVSDIMSAFPIELAERGADLEHLAVAPLGAGFAFHSHHVLHSDEALLVDFGCRYDGYVSDSATTLVLGRADDDVLRRQAAARDAVAAGAEAARSGAVGSSVYEAMRTALGRDADGASAPKGHGIGLEIREYPLIGASSAARVQDDCVDLPADIELEASMVLNLEVLGSALGRASFGVKQTLVVDNGGARLLTTQQRGEPVALTG